MNFSSGIYPNYPQGSEDNTHFTPKGAEQMVRVIIEEINNKIPELTKYLFDEYARSL